MLLGIICGGLAIGLTWAMEAVTRAFHRTSSVPRFLQPAIGAALSGVCGVALLLLIGRAGNPNGDASYVPIFAGGYPTIIQALDPAAYGAGPMELTLAVLLLLCAGKIVATAFTLGGGGSGGVFAPSLFIGATAGGALGLGLHHISAAEQPSTYALVGMGAILAAIIQWKRRP